MKIYEVGPGIIPIPCRGFGGIENVVFNVTQALKKRGHEVIIVNEKDISNYPFDPQGIIHCHWAGHALKLIERKLPYAYTSHSHIWWQTCLTAIMRSTVYLALHAGMVPDRYCGRLKVVGNGVDLDFWHDKHQPREKIVIACAHYHKRKRLEWMYDLIKLLPDEWHGIIVGPAVPDNIKYHNERIALLPEQTAEDLVRLFNRCKYGFHPAAEEAFALIPMQMAACGLLVLVAKECFVYRDERLGHLSSPIMKIMDPQDAAD
jgi:glycosyltransferase involved in cell wall biosynthesis